MRHGLLPVDQVPLTEEERLRIEAFDLKEALDAAGSCPRCTTLVKAYRRTTEWQLIETAPKDGQIILLGWTSGGIYVGRFDKEWRCWKEGNYAFCTTMTHWMPLPVPPRASDSKNVGGEIK